MNIWSNSFSDGGTIPAHNAFGRPDADSHVALSDNVSPHIGWAELPEGTRSLAIVCIDVDVPSRGDDVNQEGKTVPADLPRVDFFHWAVVNVDPSLGKLEQGAFSSGVTPRGKSGPVGPMGTLQATNSYTQWFAGDADMAGDYYGYDGPCPPWNDEVLHHYHFTAYALSAAGVALPENPDGPAVLAAIEAHTIASAAWVGTYTLNPDVGG